MANNVYQQQQQQQQQHGHQNNGNPHHCKECGLYLNSAESLEVHLQYHKENLLNKWASQAASSTHGDEANNNSTKQSSSAVSSSAQHNVIVKREFTGTTVKREFTGTTVKLEFADSSDAMIKRSPEYSSGNRATPDNSVNFGHPPTPQSYHSASSPYQTPDNSAFSPNFPSYGPKSGDRGSPAAAAHHLHFQQQSPAGAAYGNYGEQHFFQLENPAAYNQDYAVHKMGGVQSFHRYHPYGNHPQQHSSHPYDRSNVTSQVSSSSPASGSSYPPQPTPSPSPKQCDKCGFVCESASQLTEHLSVAHPPSITSGPGQQQSAPGFNAGQNQQYFSSDIHIKTEEDTQSEILDLDSHKVHQIYQEDEKQQRPNGDISNGHHNPHSVTAMLNSWPHHHQQQKMFSQSDRAFSNGAVPDFINGANNVPTTTTPEMPYRPFDQANATSGISSTQMPGGTVTAVSPSSVTVQPPITKAANWKSNEARRPKTYNCTACNKWFTSSGHLKRHYNTTLHKNAVKSSNQPDPATMPISVHHHPARESSSNREDLSSNSPTDDSRSDDCFDRTSIMQQQQGGGYERQPAPNIIHPLHSPMQLMPPQGQQTTLPGSPPNGEAGPSASTNLDSRGGLLSTTTTNNNSSTSIISASGSNNSSSSNSPLHHAQQQHLMQHHGYQLPATDPPLPPPPLGLHPPPPLHPHHHMQAAPNSSSQPLTSTSPMVAAHQHHQFQMYPNECAPHVTQATVISSLSTTGEEQHNQRTVKSATTNACTSELGSMPSIVIKAEVVDDEVEYCASEQQQHEIHAGSMLLQPLPSFSHIQSNRYQSMLLSNGAANVGGSPGLITTAPFQYYNATINNDQQRMQQNDIPLHHSQMQQEQQPNVPMQAAQMLQMSELNIPVARSQLRHLQELNTPIQETQTLRLQDVNIPMQRSQKVQIDEIITIPLQSTQIRPIQLPDSIQYEADYKLTILGPSTELHFSEDSNSNDGSLTALTAVNHISGSIVATGGGADAAYHMMDDEMEDKFKPTEEVRPVRAASPEKAKIKRDPVTTKKQTAKRKGDYEESSPAISSTTVLQAAKLLSQKSGVIHKCHECDKLFNKSCYLTQHNKTFHCGDKPFKCTRCGKRFFGEVQYVDHLSKHAGDKPHKCDQCPKQFNHKTDLRRHMCLHTGQKPYACDTCGKGFIRKDHMVKHCETHFRKASNKIKVTCEATPVN